MLFSLAATGSFGSVTRGQCAAKISYVRRPSSRESDCSVCSTISLPIISSQYLTDQPPCSKPPSRSSSGPPGACITPSIVRNVPTTSFLMCFSSGPSLLVSSSRQLEVNLLHLSLASVTPSGAPASHFANLHLVRSRTPPVHGPKLVLPRHRRIREVHDGLRVPALDELPRPRLCHRESRSGRRGLAVLPRPRRAGLREPGRGARASHRPHAGRGRSGPRPLVHR